MALVMLGAAAVLVAMAADLWGIPVFEWAKSLMPVAASDDG